MRPRKKQREQNMVLFLFFFSFFLVSSFLLSIVGDRKPRLEKVNLGVLRKKKGRSGKSITVTVQASQPVRGV